MNTIKNKAQATKEWTRAGLLIGNKRVRIYDNPNFNDRYTAVLPSGEMIGLNSNPFHPAVGMCQFCGDFKGNAKALGTPVKTISALNNDVVSAIKQYLS